ncbi:SIMPL domain-containing protein [Haladaptatus halobius]|uniref:SIMPL domain-containing protein n=1 Tax=Haladaptatus halobius TaxID=2884875 RepID=UPI001D0A01EE|nr:SIMPL domain-containing protein [Haladaptatus halobius]
MADQTITTTAIGRTSAPPDEVDLQFAARAVDPDVTTARRTAADQALALRQELDAMGIPDERIRTSQFRIQQRPPDRRGPSASDSTSQPYQATEIISVVLFDLDRLGDVLSAAVDEAGVEINEVAFTFQTETQRDLRQKAIADAVVTARKNATAAATAEDMFVGSVQSIVTDPGSRPRRLRAGQALAMETAESGSVESGPIEVSVSVDVEYRLEEP